MQLPLAGGGAHLGRRAHPGGCGCCRAAIRGVCTLVTGLIIGPASPDASLFCRHAIPLCVSSASPGAIRIRTCTVRTG
ncbi:hypothetical protein, partial [Aeromonas sp. ZOR0002]|uniref:hypothetical protein n=1 Tax=Aeromonas sp. ZOR0002 TaxID=1339228 RepID=UPI001E61215E